MNKQINDFISELSSKSPVPGGGGASALIGSLGSALCSMVANLTSGKKKYAEFQGDIDAALAKLENFTADFLLLIEKDAIVFEPLSAAYGIPKENPEREEIMEKALKNACTVPIEILKLAENASLITEELAYKGSKLAVSDVGVAAAAIKAAAEGAIMNVYINTKLMKDRDFAEKSNNKAISLLNSCVERCSKVYNTVAAELTQ